jgi:hypothetical protein
MWLEGAVQNDWSVSNMRRSRWETLGALPDQKPLPGDVVTSETDEDFEPARNETPSTITGRYEEVQGPNLSEGPDFGDDDDPAVTEMRVPADIAQQDAPMRPFENLAPLPDDVADAFEQFKLVILRHKAERWSQISCDDLLASLDSLKQLALAPSAEDAPF